MERKQSLFISNPWLRYGLYLLLLLPLMLGREATPANELRYLAIADEALRDGHLWCFFLDGAAYADKPPLYLWIVMLLRRIMGFHCLPVIELFSLIPALLTLRVMDRTFGRSLQWPVRITAELSLMSAAWFLGSAIVLRMDMLMTLFITLALETAWKILRGECTTRRKWIFGLYLFLAVFSKGPVGLLLPLTGTLVWMAATGRLREAGKLWGWRTWVALAVPCLIWWGCAWAEGGRTYMDNLLVHQTVDRAVNAFHHKRPFWYYLYSIWYAMAPAALICLPALIWGAFRRIRLKEEERFLLIVSGAFFILMSLVSSKLEIYMLPIFGPVIYGSFAVLQSLRDTKGCRRSAENLRRAAFWAACTILAAAAIAGCFFIDKVNSLTG